MANIVYNRLAYYTFIALFKMQECVPLPIHSRRQRVCIQLHAFEDAPGVVTFTINMGNL